MRTAIAALVVAAASPAQQPADAAPALDEARYRLLRAQLRPEPDAPWRTIPWQLDLLAARREAAASRRPLFVWAMDGHPLGCT